MSEKANLQGGGRIQRLMQLLWLLPGPRRWNKDALARHFEISPRTVLRDIQHLRESGIAIECDPKTGVYHLAEARLSCSELAPLELLALALAPELITLPDLRFLRRYWETAIGKLLTAVKAPQRAGVQQAIRQIRNLVDDRPQTHKPGLAHDDPLFGDLAEHAVIELIEYWMSSGNERKAPTATVHRSADAAR
jgi:predicted DNA-binding transcriptional regulator YafY